MSKIIWIASYPKSGNTWVRFLVANLLFGAVDSAATLARMIPDVHELGATPAVPTQPTLMKTHFPCGQALPLRVHTVGAIYVLRDPADIMLSNYHYGRRSGTVSEADGGGFARYVDAFIAGQGDARWQKMGMGTWGEHVHSWLGTRHAFPVLRIRYEDLGAQGPDVAQRLCRSLGIKRTREQIEHALAASSFERMREIEERDIEERQVGIFYKPYLQPSIDAGLRFMRAGRSGEAARTLSTDQWGRFEAVFGAIRRELGYG